MGDEASGIGEDKVVNIGVFHGRESVLDEAVAKEDDSESDCGGEDIARAGEEAVDGSVLRHCV